MLKNILILITLTEFILMFSGKVYCQNEQDFSINFKIGTNPSFKQSHIGDQTYHNFNIDIGVSKPVGHGFNVGIHINAFTINTPDIIYKQGFRYVDDEVNLEGLYETRFLSIQTMGLGLIAEIKIKAFYFLAGTNFGYRSAAYSELSLIEVEERKTSLNRRMENGSNIEFPDMFHRFDIHLRLGTYVDIFKGFNLGAEWRQGLNNIVKEGPNTRYFDYALFVGYKFKI